MRIVRDERDVTKGAEDASRAQGCRSPCSCICCRPAVRAIQRSLRFGLPTPGDKTPRALLVEIAGLGWVAS